MAFAFAGQYGPEPVIDRYGNAIYSATFRVLTTTGAEATVYTDRTKATTVSQPLDVDGEANATFYAAPGRYTVELTAGGSVTSFPVGVVPDAEDVAPRDPAGWTEGNAAYLSRNDTLVIDAASPAYGVVADSDGLGGGTDNAAAIQAAINDAEAATGPRIVLLPVGRIKFASGLVIDTRGVALVGAGGIENTKLDYTGATADAVRVTCDGLTELAGFQLIDVGGLGTNGVTFAFNGTYTGSRYACTFVQVNDFSGKGFNLTNCEQSDFEDCVAQGCGTGWYADNSNHTGGGSQVSNTFSRCRGLSSTGPGWDVNNQEGSEFTACQGLQNGSTQFVLRGGSRACTIDHLNVENDVNAGVGTGLSVSGNEHVVSVAAYSLATGVALASSIGCGVLPSKFASVTTPVTLDAASTDNVAFGTGYTVSDSGSNNTIFHTGARASSIGSSWVHFQDGTAGVPSLSFKGDSDTGFFRESANFIGVATGGTRRFGFDTARFFLTAGHYFQVGTPHVRSGTGTPEGAVTAPVGSLFMRDDGGAGTTLYVKESGVGNTGWVAK